MKHLMKDDSGATSVLVVFMMVVLVVFATLAFTTAFANYRLAQRASAVTNENYHMETAAMQAVLQVDGALAQAEKRMQQAMGQDPLQGSISGITLSQGQQVQRHFAQGVPPDRLEELVTRLYLQYAGQELQELAQEAPIQVAFSQRYADGHFMDFGKEAPDQTDILVTLALSTGTQAGDKQLDVELGVVPLRYEGLGMMGTAITGDRAQDQSRTSVRVWRQWQVPFTYEDGMEFGDPSVALDISAQGE